MGKGPLVRVMRNGALVKMYRQDAIDQGLIPGEKSVAKTEDKSRVPMQDKSVPGPTSAKTAGIEPEEDDFTVIEGIGPATSRQLHSRGIKTFDQLREAGAMDFLSIRAMEAIEEWRRSG